MTAAITPPGSGNPPVRRSRTNDHGTFIGTYRGAGVWARVDDGRHIIHTRGVDFTFPVDVNAAFQRWITARVTGGAR